MMAERNGRDNSGADAGAAGARQISMIITVDLDTLQVQVTGPLHQPVFALGILEMARQAVEAYHRGHADSSERKIIPAVALPWRPSR